MFPDLLIAEENTHTHTNTTNKKLNQYEHVYAQPLRFRNFELGFELAGQWLPVTMATIKEHLTGENTKLKYSSRLLNDHPTHTYSNHLNECPNTERHLSQHENTAPSTSTILPRCGKTFAPNVANTCPN